MGDPARVLEQALDLSIDERARVARVLIASLDERNDGDADEAWQAEVRARLDAVEAGAVELDDWRELRDLLRASSKRP
jgi:putative addiction module component (TIGR02574 family)